MLFFVHVIKKWHDSFSYCQRIFAKVIVLDQSGRFGAIGGYALAQMLHCHS